MWRPWRNYWWPSTCASCWAFWDSIVYKRTARAAPPWAHHLYLYLTCKHLQKTSQCDRRRPSLLPLVAIGIEFSFSGFDLRHSCVGERWSPPCYHVCLLESVWGRGLTVLSRIGCACPYLFLPFARHLSQCRSRRHSPPVVGAFCEHLFLIKHLQGRWLSSCQTPTEYRCLYSSTTRPFQRLHCH